MAINFGGGNVFSGDTGATISNAFKKAGSDIKGSFQTEFTKKKPAEFSPASSQVQETFESQVLSKIPNKEQVFGKNPTIDPGILGPSIDYTWQVNPFSSLAETAIGQATGPDFSAAQQTAGKQADLAQALQNYYGTGSGAVTGLIGDLQQQAQGNFGPRGSLAQAMLQQGLNRNIAGVRSQLASQRGLSPALAARYAAQQTAQLGGQTAEQAGIMGLQQQIAAQEQLGRLGMGAAELGGGVAGQLISKGREQDITQAATKAEADFNKMNALASNDVELKKLAAQTGIAEAEIKAKIAMANQAAAIGDREMATQIAGGIIGAMGQVAAAAALSPAGAAYGGRIRGQALVDGDHPKNDTVPAMLSPGEIVIPRTAAQDKKKAKAFLDALDGWDEKPSYSKVLKAKRKRA